VEYFCKNFSTYLYSFVFEMSCVFAVAVDDSTCGQKAFQWALNFVRDRGCIGGVLSFLLYRLDY
jgi:hypothetical protein